MVDQAWTAHCGRIGTARKDKAAKDLWYRGELLLAIGRQSTSDAHPGRDFETCMAHFEAIVGDSIYWNTQLFQGDCRRILFSINQICKKHTISEAYVLGTARKLLQLPGLNNLHEVEDPQDLSKVRVALLIHAKRKAKETLLQDPEDRSVLSDPSDLPDPENCPF